MLTADEIISAWDADDKSVLAVQVDCPGDEHGQYGAEVVGNPTIGFVGRAYTADWHVGPFATFAAAAEALRAAIAKATTRGE